MLYHVYYNFPPFTCTNALVIRGAYSTRLVCMPCLPPSLVTSIVGNHHHAGRDPLCVPCWFKQNSPLPSLVLPHLSIHSTLQKGTWFFQLKEEVHRSPLILCIWPLTPMCQSYQIRLPPFQGRYPIVTGWLVSRGNIYPNLWGKFLRPF